MSFLIDTCALSELLKPRPSPRVSEWFDAAPSEALFVSVLTLGEIRKGIEKLGSSRRRARIAAWLETELPAWFEDRVLPIDTGVADEWGRLMGPPEETDARHRWLDRRDRPSASVRDRHPQRVRLRRDGRRPFEPLEGLRWAV